MNQTLTEKYLTSKGRNVQLVAKVGGSLILGRLRTCVVPAILGGGDENLSPSADDGKEMDKNEKRTCRASGAIVFPTKYSTSIARNRDNYMTCFFNSLSRCQIRTSTDSLS